MSDFINQTLFTPVVFDSNIPETELTGKSLTLEVERIEMVPGSQNKKKINQGPTLIQRFDQNLAINYFSDNRILLRSR
jgi:hypothetical protein